MVVILALVFSVGSFGVVKAGTTRKNGGVLMVILASIPKALRGI